MTKRSQFKYDNQMCSKMCKSYVYICIYRSYISDWASSSNTYTSVKASAVRVLACVCVCVTDTALRWKRKNAESSWLSTRESKFLLRVSRPSQHQVSKRGSAEFPQQYIFWACMSCLLPCELVAASDSSATLWHQRVCAQVPQSLWRLQQQTQTASAGGSEVCGVNVDAYMCV